MPCEPATASSDPTGVSSPNFAWYTKLAHVSRLAIPIFSEALTHLCGLQGNSQSRRSQQAEHATNDSYGDVSPPFSPGSPLTYVPQMPMEPALSRSEDTSMHRGSYSEFRSDVAGWPTQPRLIPTKLLCKHMLRKSTLLPQACVTSIISK